METDTRSSLGQSASETEEDSVSISKKEVRDGAGWKECRRWDLGTKTAPILSVQKAVAADAQHHVDSFCLIFISPFEF